MDISRLNAHLEPHQDMVVKGLVKALVKALLKALDNTALEWLRQILLICSRNSWSLRVWSVPLRKIVAIQTHDSKRSTGILFDEQLGKIQVWNKETYSVLEICPKTNNFLPTKSKNAFLVNQKPSFPENLNK